MDDKQYHPSNSGEMQSSTPVQDERAVFRKRVLKIGGAVTLVLVGLFTLPIPFGSLKIVGSDKVTVQDVMVAGDIHEPVNILQISTEKLKTRLAKDLRVEEAQISYQLPFTMVGRVIERKAAVAACTSAQFGYLTLDSKGQVIASELCYTRYVGTNDIRR
ncbi:MAG: cell division protein FtsQ/DivIB [Veillonella sp.]